MSGSDEPLTVEANEAIAEAYILDVRIVKCPSQDGTDVQYRFEAPEHIEVTFDDFDAATLYADVYFDVNGFTEAGTGERGVPPEIIQAGRDTLAAYFLTQPYADVNWVASFYGKKPVKIRRYVAAVRQRAREIREGATERDME